MQVNNITIEHQTFDTAKNAYVASVVLELENQQLSSFLCSVQAQQDCGAAQRDAAMISEAARQARRMPEFRSGRDSLVFPDDLFIAA